MRCSRHNETLGTIDSQTTTIRRFHIKGVAVNEVHDMAVAMELPLHRGHELNAVHAIVEMEIREGPINIQGLRDW